MKYFGRERGFTLLEIILTLVLLGVVAVMGVSFFSKGVTRTDVPIQQLKVDANLQLVLENMIQDAKKSGDLQYIYNKIGSVGSMGTNYVGSYYVANRAFVCPNATNTFVADSTHDQFLLVTIKPNATSGVSLTYIFGNNNTSSVCGE